MEHRGYFFDERASDLVVNLAAVAVERQGLRATPGEFPASGGVETEDYRLGRLAIDLFDACRQQVVWHGSAEGRVSPIMQRDAGTAAEKAVAVVFEDFPVRVSARAVVAAPTAPHLLRQ